MSQSQPVISLCMIVRNEARLIQGCLDSVRAAVDEMIVVDTGSSDATAELARAAGACVYSFQWTDDFSAARNFSLERASGRWALIVDADERLAPGGSAALRGAAAAATFDCGLLARHDAAHLDAPLDQVVSGRGRIGAPLLLPRLLRLDTRPRFEGVVHEEPTAWLAERTRAGRVARVPAHLVHLGRANGLGRGESGLRRNLETLERAAACAPSRPDTYGYLAMEHLKLGQAEAAWAAAEQGWALVVSGAPINRRAHLMLAEARALLQLQHGDEPAAIATLEAAEAAAGPHPRLSILRGAALYRLACAQDLRFDRPETSPDESAPPHRGSGKSPRGRSGAEVLAIRTTSTPAVRSRLNAEAADAFRGALDLLATYPPGSAPAGALQDAWYGLGLTELLSEEPARALACFQAALAQDPAHLPSRLGLAEALLSTGLADDALAQLEPLLGAAGPASAPPVERQPLTSTPDAWLLAALAAEQLGAHADARLLLKQAVRARQARPYLAPHRAHLEAALQAAGPLTTAPLGAEGRVP